MSHRIIEAAPPPARFARGRHCLGLADTFKRFYVDAADVTPEMTNRFEFEIDTERAVTVWQKEVEENVANGVSFSVIPQSLRS